jgi:hypothetical protein
MRELFFQRLNNSRSFTLLEPSEIFKRFRKRPFDPSTVLRTVLRLGSGQAQGERFSTGSNRDGVRHL